MVCDGAVGKPPFSRWFAPGPPSQTGEAENSLRASVAKCVQKTQGGFLDEGLIAKHQFLQWFLAPPSANLSFYGKRCYFLAKSQIGGLRKPPCRQLSIFTMVCDGAAAKPPFLRWSVHGPPLQTGEPEKNALPCRRNACNKLRIFWGRRPQAQNTNIYNGF